MTHYEVLGVAPDASPEHIRFAYRAMARRLHPDAQGAPPDAQARMARCNEAWSVLSDPDRRALYDAELRLAAGRSADPGPWRPRVTVPRPHAPPPRRPLDMGRAAPLVQVVGPVFLLVGILMLAVGFVMLRPPMLVFGLLMVVIGLYAMVATAVLALRRGRGRR
jgi:hypothetical protein